MSANPAKICTRIVANLTCSVSGVGLCFTCIHISEKGSRLNSYNEKLHDQYSTQNTQWIKSRIERWPWHIAAHRVFWLGNLTEREHFEDLNVDE